MVATWDDSDEQKSDDEEQQEMTNLALMAIGEELFDELEEQQEMTNLPTYDELHNAFKELHDEWIKIGKTKMLKLTNENYALQKCNDSLNEHIKELELDNKMLHDRIASLKGKQKISYDNEKSHVDELKKENEMLKKKNNELNEIVLKFTNRQKMLDNLLNSQKCVFDKGGIGYKPNLKQKYYKNYFVSNTSINNQVICYCNQDGHMKNIYPVKRNAYYGVKCIWVSKGTIANTQGPKKFWVPKTWKLFLQGSKKRKNKWYLDSGCSRHMTENYYWFSSSTKVENGGNVSFEGNSKRKIIGVGNVSNVSSTLIENVCLVENLKHNLLSISQLCGKGYKVIFDKTRCVIENACDGKILFVGNRCVNVYTINIDCASTHDKYFSALHDDGWL